VSVTLDGSAVYWKGSSVAVANGKAGTVAAWFKASSIPASGAMIVVSRTSGEALTGFHLIVNSLSGLTLVGRNAATTAILSMVTANSLVTAGTWYLALASWDLAQGAGKIYLNDTDRTPVGPTLTNDTITYDLDEWRVGGGATTGDALTSMFPGELSYVFFSTTYTDLATETNRRRFIGESLEAIGLGPDASRGTGVRPEIFLAGGAGNFGRNLGSGGDLATFGSPTSSAGRPAAVETLSRSLRGEEWRESQRSGIPFPASELVLEPASGLEVARREYSTDRGEMERARHRRHHERG